MATSLTCDESDAALSVPADTDAIVQGSGDRITLAAGDRLTVQGAGDVVTASPDSIVALSPAALGTVIAASGAATILYRGTDPGAGATATIDVGPGTIDILEQPGAADPIPVAIPAGAASIVVDAFGTGNADGQYDLTRAYSSAGGRGTLLGTVVDTTTDTSFTTIDVGGAFGVTRQVFHHAGFQGRGSLLDTVTDYVAPSATGYAARSFVQYAAGNPFLAPAVSTETDRYSGPDLQGALLSSTIDFTDGTSAVATPGDGAFGVYRTANLYAGPDGTGTLFGHRIDYVAATAGGGIAERSTSTYAGTGAYGVFRTAIRTGGADGSGPVTATILDIVDGRSITLTPGLTGASAETETVTAGPDGTGRVLSATTVAAGTAAGLFQAFTRLPASIAAEIARATLRPADFAATAILADHPRPQAPIPLHRN